MISGRGPVGPASDSTETKVDMLRAERERHFRLNLHDPQPVERPADVWGPVAKAATVGMFVLMLIAALYFARSLFLPVVVALVIGETLAPVIEAAAARGVPRFLTATLLVAGGMALVGLAVTLAAAPVGEMIARAPELGASVKDKLYVFDRPLAALRGLQETIAPQTGNVVRVDSGWTEIVAPLAGILTPAIGQLVLFVIVLLFVLAGERDARNFIVTLMPSREAKLRFLRIATDIRHNLAGYVWVVTLINLSLGAIVTAGAWALGFPSPLLLGLTATLLNYIPYLGSAVTAVVLFAVGLVIFPTLGQALIAPAGYVVIASIEGHIVTPTILGRRMTLNPLTIILALAFWTWMWGPMGAFIAAPLTIVGLVTLGHLFPSDEPQLPE